MADPIKAPITYPVLAGGKIVAGGSVIFGEANVKPDPDNPATLKDVYTDQALTIIAQNPQGLDSNGVFDQSATGILYGNTADIYSVVIRDASGNQLAYIPEYDLSDANAAVTAQEAATAAQNAEASAITAKDLTEDLYSDFLIRYFGAYASDPSVNDEGNPPQEGSLYWNADAKRFKVYDGAAWDFTDISGLGTAAYRDHGSADDEVPLNSDIRIVSLGVDSFFAASLEDAKNSTRFSASGGQLLTTDGRSSQGDRGAANWLTISGTGTANGFDIVAHNTLNISFVLQPRENSVTLMQYGGNADAAAFQSYLDYLSTERIEGILDQSVTIDSTVNIKSNVTLRAANTNFSASIVLTGGAQIQIGLLGVDTFSVLLENILVWGDQSSARDVILIGEDAFSIKMNNIRIFNLDATLNANKTGLRTRTGGDIRITNLIIRGKPSGTRPKYGIVVEDVTGTPTGNNGLTLINPDVEFCEQCYRFEGARADVYSIYLERYSDTGIWIDDLASVNIHGGLNIQSGGSGTPGKIFGGNVNVYSLELFDFAGAGYNLFDLQAGTHQNVNFYGIDPDLIGQASGSQGIVGVYNNSLQTSTNMVTANYGNTKIDVADAVATKFYTIKNTSSSSKVPIWYKLRVWAVSEGFGKSLQTYEGIITRDGSSAQLKTSPAINETSAQNSSGNWSITLSAALVAGATINEVDIEVTLDLTGTLNNGGTEDVFTTLEITTTNTDAEVIVL